MKRRTKRDRRCHITITCQSHIHLLRFFSTPFIPTQVSGGGFAPEGRDGSCRSDWWLRFCWQCWQNWCRRRRYVLSLSATIRLTDICRYLPSMQVFTLPKSEHEIPCQPRMLPQDVRVLCGPHLLPWARSMPCSRVSKDIEEAPISSTDIRGYQGGAGSRHQKKSGRGVQ